MTRDDLDHKVGVENPPANPPARSGVAGAMAVAAVLGAVIGAVIGAVFLPDFIIALALGGALTLAALRVFVFMSSDRRGLTPLKDEDGKGE